MVIYAVMRLEETIQKMSIYKKETMKVNESSLYHTFNYLKSYKLVPSNTTSYNDGNVLYLYYMI